MAELDQLLDSRFRQQGERSACKLQCVYVIPHRLEDILKIALSQRKSSPSGFGLKSQHVGNQDLRFAPLDNCWEQPFHGKRRWLANIRRGRESGRLSSLARAERARLQGSEATALFPIDTYGPLGSNGKKRPALGKRALWKGETNSATSSSWPSSLLPWFILFSFERGSVRPEWPRLVAERVRSYNM